MNASTCWPEIRQEQEAPNSSQERSCLWPIRMGTAHHPQSNATWKTRIETISVPPDNISLAVRHPLTLPVPDSILACVKQGHKQNGRNRKATIFESTLQSLTDSSYASKRSQPVSCPGDQRAGFKAICILGVATGGVAVRSDGARYHAGEQCGSGRRTSVHPCPARGIRKAGDAYSGG
jgi:ribosomal protein L27